jgi:hypothetical protein
MPRNFLFATLFLFLACSMLNSLPNNIRAAGSYAPPSKIATEPEPQSARTLCDRNEQVVFSCAMQKSAKILSICTSRQLNSASGYIQYRFGLPGKIELEFPAERVNSQSAFGYTRYTRPLVTFLTLRFESNGHKYSIHQDSNAEEKPPANSSYVTVTSPDPNTKVIEMTCRQPVQGSLMLLEDIVPRSEESEVAAH